MNTLKLMLIASLFLSANLKAQETFAVTAASIPQPLLKLNYGTLPAGIDGLDLNICNVTGSKQSITSSAIFQALAQSQQGQLHPIGRQIMLAAILRNQNHSVKTLLSVGLGTTTSVLSVLRNRPSLAQSRTLSLVGLGALIGQQVVAAWSPVLTADQVEKFESQVLEPALVMDSGSCLERTVFVVSSVAPHRKSKPVTAHFEFRIR